MYSRRHRVARRVGILREGGEGARTKGYGALLIIATSRVACVSDRDPTQSCSSGGTQLQPDDYTSWASQSEGPG